MNYHTPPLMGMSQAVKQAISKVQGDSALKAPLIILSAPRSGSSLLFEQLTQLKGAWNIGGESHKVFRHFPHLRFENKQLDSASLGAQHADPVTIALMRENFLFHLQDHQSNRLLEQKQDFDLSHGCLVEKTPRNALNIPFLLKVFPDAKFVFLHRKAEENIASIIEAWKLGLETGRFATFPNLPGWDRKAWCFLLPSNWRSMMGKSLADIAAFQWAQSNQTILEQLSMLPQSRWTSLSYQQFIAHPEQQMAKIAKFANINASSDALDLSKLSKSTLAPPNENKWRAHQDEIIPLVNNLSELVGRLQSLSEDAQS
jgi:hypothetical protein